MNTAFGATSTTDQVLDSVRRMRAQALWQKSEQLVGEHFKSN
jgi:hypothetical protein